MSRGIYNKLASWLAIFAVLMAFFAPTVSQAMSADDHLNVVYQKVCTENGSKVIPMELPSGKHDGMLGHARHCAFCCTSAHMPIVGSNTISFVVAVIESPAWILPAYDSPVVQSIYQDSHTPQAPPSI